MRTVRRVVVGLSLAAVCLAAPAGLRALVLDVDQDQAYRAIAIGRSADAERARFHARYVVPVSDASIERAELLTAFRRVVVETERRLSLGDHMFGARQAADLLKPWRGKLTIIVRVRFHPHNVFVTMPAYEVVVASPAGAEVRLGDVRRTPIWAMAEPNQKRGTSTALIGAVVESDFDAAAVGQSMRVVTVMLEGHVLARATIDFARLD
jgi:hypothetical protein